MTVRAFIAVDIQNDFCEGGALGVEGGAAVAERVAAHLDEHADSYDVLVATRDWHTNRTVDHFAADGQDPDYATTWPVHCMAGTAGADYHPALLRQVALRPFVEILKGQAAAAYSGFDGTLMTDSMTSLASVLRDAGVTDLTVAGIATDYCVKATVLDALTWMRANRIDGTVTVVSDLVAAVNNETGQEALNSMLEAGAEIRTTKDLSRVVRP